MSLGHLALPVNSYFRGQMAAYYNEIDPYAAQWLRNLISAGLIPAGDVDDRSIADVSPGDLGGYTQCHFFAGLGGWLEALALAGWSSDQPVWTGSCPCQPFSLAGDLRGFSDERHLWPQWLRLISKCSPPVIFGEQVAGATQWLGLVRGDLETMGYAVGAIPIEAASAGSYQLRDRFWFVADRDRGFSVGRAEIEVGRPQGRVVVGGVGGGHLQTAECADGKWRPIPPPGVRWVGNGIPARVAKLRAFGNAIDPRPAAEFIGAYMSSINGESKS